MKTKFFLNLLISCTSIIAFGQVQQEQIKLTNGEILIGSVAFGDDFPYEIEFQKQNSKKRISYSTDQVKHFWNNAKYYQVKSVPDKEKPVFLETIQSGEVSLYLLAKDYYVEKEDMLYRLSKRDKEETTGIRQDKRYVGMLKFLFFDCLKKSKKEWSQIKFSDKSLAKIVAEYNDCQSSNAEQINYLKNRNRAKTYVYAVGMVTQMAAAGARFSEAVLTPSFSIGLYGEVLPEKVINPLLGLQFSSKNGKINHTIFNTNGTATTYGYNLGLIEAPILFKFRLFRPKLNNEVFIIGGGIFGASIYKRSFNNSPGVTSSRISAPLQASGLFGWRIGLGYIFQTTYRNMSVNYFYEQNGFGAGVDIKLHGICIAQSLRPK